jgi:hypothetical protein
VLDGVRHSQSTSKFKATGDVKSATRNFTQASGAFKLPDDGAEVVERGTQISRRRRVI